MTTETKTISRPKTNKVRADELKPGDVIDPPAGERKWLWRDGVKRRYAVTSVEPGKRTKKGLFVKVKATCPSPYSTPINEPFEIDCQILESKLVALR